MKSSWCPGPVAEACAVPSLLGDIGHLCTSPSLSLPVCILGPQTQVSPWFHMDLPRYHLLPLNSPSPRCDWAGPRGTPEPAWTKNINVPSQIKGDIHVSVSALSGLTI